MLRSYERSSDKWTKPAQFSKITRYVNHNKNFFFFNTFKKTNPKGIEKLQIERKTEKTRKIRKSKIKINRNRKSRTCKRNRIRRTRKT